MDQKSILGGILAILAAMVGKLGLSWGDRGQFVSHLESSWGRLGRLGDVLGGYWRRLGFDLGGPGAFLRGILAFGRRYK